LTCAARAATLAAMVPAAIADTDATLGWLGALPPAAAAALIIGVLAVVPALAVLGAVRFGLSMYRDDALVGWLRLVAQIYSRRFQGLKVEGTHLIPRTIGPEGLVIVSTHVAGLDPVSLQALVPHPIRWMMSAEMMLPSLVWLWRRLRIIPVCYDARDAAALKAAIAHVSSGGVLGIFPEGAIERPPRQLRPFVGGLRLILSRTKAPVLVVAIDPGRAVENAYAALWTRTNPSMRFLALIEPPAAGHGKDASDRIFELLRRETGWPVNESPMGAVDPETVDRNLRAYGNHG